MDNKPKYLSTIRTLIYITIGATVFGTGVQGFIVPHQLLSGGISGLSLIIYYITQGVLSLGAINFLLNIPVLYAAWRWLGRWHLGVTLFGTLFMSVIINVLAPLSTLELTHNPIIGGILGGLFSGLGLGIVYRGGGNTGGIDPIALIIRNRFGLQIGSILFGINMMILVAGAIVINIEAAATTLISTYLSAMVTNKVISGFNQRKAMFIISYKPVTICNLIIEKLGRGATILNGEGAYTHQPKQVIMVVVSLLQVARLKAAVEAEDPTAFMVITDAAEVIGTGFSAKSTKGAVERVLQTCDPVKEAEAEQLIHEVQLARQEIPDDTHKEGH
ncbi:YitT family protein [Veillonella sp. CHU110]|uniref:YitT family protein n=1 Tax=Veillonella sp. CHU110 TaxID=2490947 RepID=UPI000F8E2F0D|nr:YitT family protein [Veillonella sp. CHU110]